jgi:hypothetical protein
VGCLFRPDCPHTIVVRANAIRTTLGIGYAGATVANAIYNASAARIDDYPITLKRVLSALPDQARSGPFFEKRPKFRF